MTTLKHNNCDEVDMKINRMLALSKQRNKRSHYKLTARDSICYQASMLQGRKEDKKRENQGHAIKICIRN